MMRGAGARPLLPYNSERGGSRGRSRRRCSPRQLVAFFAGALLCVFGALGVLRRGAPPEFAPAGGDGVAYNADGAYVNAAAARPAGGGFRDGYRPDTVAAEARAPDKPGDSPATILRRLVAAVTLQERASQEVSMLSSLVKSLAMGGDEGLAGAAERVARARATQSGTGSRFHWNYAAGAEASGDPDAAKGWSPRPTLHAAPPQPPAPPSPPSRYAALGAAGAAPVQSAPRPQAAALGGEAAASAWARVTADETRREAVRNAMRHAWASYAKHAFGYDELQPQARRGKNGFGGMGATVVDAIDTLYIMNLTAEYEAARVWIRDELRFDRSFDASVFETTIRIVGGLLAANHLSGDDMFVTRARELADRLTPAFDTPTGIPYSTINLRSGRTRNSAWTQSASPLAEFGTTQLEFMALSDATGDPSYGERSEGVIRMLTEASNRMTGPAAGLFPLYLNPTTNAFTSHKVSFGAMGDSFYEYLLKMWLVGGRTPALAPYRRMWEAAMESLIAVLLHRSKPGGWSYITELDRGMQVHKMDHLACFVPGMLVLGSQGDVAERYLALAKDLSDTCVQMYAGTATGLSPELVNFRDGRDMFTNDRSAHNLLRPEAVESLFYLYRRTGDETYRAQGWQIFRAFEKHCRLTGGYAGVRDVRVTPAVNDDTQQSFFLAETLKYLYLLFSDSDTVDLEQWVFNTEAHPLRVTRRDTSLLAEAEAPAAEATTDELAALAAAAALEGPPPPDDVAEVEVPPVRRHAPAPEDGPRHATHREASDDSGPPSRRAWDDTYAGKRAKRPHMASLEADEESEESEESSEDSASDGAWLHRDSAR